VLKEKVFLQSQKNKMKNMKSLHIITVLVGCLLTMSCGNKDKNESIAVNNNATEQSAPADPLADSVKRGKAVYMELCITCHLANGKGVPGAFPPLNPSNWLIEKRTESIHAVKYGLKGPIQVNGKPYDNVMLPLGLDDQEVADVMNYSIQTWNKGKIVTLEEVKAVKK
jgi:mono/diheme cytochrome c family protein